MKNFFALALLLTVSLSAFAQEADLVLAGEKWLAKHTGVVCAAFTPTVALPAGFANIDVKFEKITTDMTLDNGLIKATFVENGNLCRYNALLLADNTASTIRLVESKAYSATKKNADCSNGKSVLDAALESNDYLYYGHPHNLAIMVEVEGTEAVCNGSKLIGINFVVAGKVPGAK
jgi:hypothetical protein